jgi:hypothetical protein
MTFGELLYQEKENIDEILNRMFELYEGQEKNREGYVKVFNTLAEMEPKETDMVLNIKHVKQDYEFADYTDEWEDVHGTNGRTMAQECEGCDSDEEVSWALEFQAWNKWVGMKIAEDTMERYSVNDVIAHCLFEVTFMGFDEKTIQEELKNINDIKDEALGEYDVQG